MIYELNNNIEEKQFTINCLENDIALLNTDLSNEKKIFSILRKIYLKKA